MAVFFGEIQLFCHIIGIVARTLGVNEINALIYCTKVIDVIVTRKDSLKTGISFARSEKSAVIAG